MLAPPSPVVRPPGLLKRIADAIAKPPAARPFAEMGVTGTVTYSGYVQTAERHPKWVGRQRYVAIADMAVNTSIIAAGVHYFLNLIAHPQWNVAPADESDQAKAAAELVEGALHGMDAPLARFIRRAGTYRFYGFGIQEWTAKKALDGTVGLQSIETRPQHTIEQWVVADDGTVEGVWQRHPKSGELLGLPRKKFLYLVEDTLTDSPEGVGLFRHLAEPWERLKAYYALEARAFERDLRGIPVGRIPYSLLNEAVKGGELKQNEADALVRGMEEFVQLQVKESNTSITMDSLPYYSQAADGAKVAGLPQWGLELLQGSSTGVEALSAAIIRTQTEMARILTVEHLMMGESSGNRSLGEDKSRNLYLVANAVLEDIAMGVTNDIVPHICMLNGIPEELYPYCEPEDVAFKDAESVAATLQKMALAGAVLAPDDPVISDVRALMGVSEPSPIPPELVGMAPSPDAQLAADREDERAAEEEEEPEEEDVEKGFDPNQARDNAGQWTRGGWKVGGDFVTAYHGASSAVAKKILKQGIKPGRSDQLAWVARDKSTAELFGSIAAKDGKPAVLFEVRIPRASLGAFKVPAVGRSAALPSVIPAEWISGYALFDPKSGKAGKLTSVGKAVAGAVYVVVVDEEEVEKAFDPSQPRDERGKWSETEVGTVEALTRLAEIPRVASEASFFHSGPEVSATTIWPDAKGHMMIFAHSKPSGEWEVAGTIDPRTAIPSQPAVTVEGVGKYLRNPSSTPVGGEGAIRVSMYQGRAHINTGTHRMASLTLRNVSSVPVIMTFFGDREGRGGRSEIYQIKPPGLQKAFDPGRLGKFVTTKAFNPAQPRVPAGSSEGGQFGSGGGSATAVSNGVGEMSAKEFSAAKKELETVGVLDHKGNLTAFHITTSDLADAIREEGLVPAKSPPAGQTWDAEHSGYATYFHLSRDAVRNEMDNLADMGLDADDYSVVAVQIPFNRKNASRFLPDEDVSTNPRDWLVPLKERSSIALIGGAYPEEIYTITPGGKWRGVEKAAPKTLYVKRQLLNPEYLLEWAASQGIATALPPEDMHVTVAFSKAEVDWATLSPDPYRATAVGGDRAVHQFPPRNTPNGALVLKFASPHLTERWQYYKDAGASWDFPDYQPHVTLTYSVPEADVAAIEPYTGPLAFGPEELAEVDEGWAGEIRETPLVKAYNPNQPRDEQGRWIFHGTSDAFLPGVEAVGLTDPDEHVMFTTSLEGAQTYARMRTDPRLGVGGKPVVFRTRSEDVVVNRIYDEGSGLIYNVRNVTPRKLERLTASGEWVPVKKGVKKGVPRRRRM